MDHDQAQEFVTSLYKNVLRRKPSPPELERWISRAVGDLSPAAMVAAFHNSKEAIRRIGVSSAFPHGHYYSPVVDPTTIRDYFNLQHDKGYKDFTGIKISPEKMLRFWEDNLAVIQSTPFQDAPSPENRFHYDGAPFPYGDATILRAMIGRYRPARIVEIGSGFSSACMLDSADQFKLDSLDLTCIDPDATRLRGLLRAADFDRIKILETPVQQVPIQVFQTLKANDILFIDSTHVLKTGSDVHYELFSILPSLDKGVIVHFHDCPYPFEYNQKWVFDVNYSWNEVYAVRAFLMYNSAFKLLYWNSLVSALFPERVKETYPIYLKNPGSGMWVEKTA